MAWAVVPRVLCPPSVDITDPLSSDGQQPWTSTGSAACVCPPSLCWFARQHREPVMLITSRHNPQVKQIRALQNRKVRDHARHFFVDGVRLVAEATQVRADVELLVVAPDLLTS